jgi:uncharacterized protein YjdB
MRGNALVLMACIGLSLSTACMDPESTTPEAPAATTAPLMAPRGIVPWVEPSLIQAAPSGHLVYYGGRLVSNMQVVQVLWGTGSYLSGVTSTATPSMATFYQQVLNSDYAAWFDHDYNSVTPSPMSGTAKTNQHIGAGSFTGQYTITPSVTGSNITDTQIQSEIAAQISAGHLPAPTLDAAGNTNTYYAVYFPHGISIRQGTSRSCVNGGFCAYHGTIANVGGHEVYYGVHPDMQPGSGCDVGCGTSPTTFGNQTSVASHEMTETITDCEVGLATVVGPPLAWYDTTLGEIGDICNANQGTFVGGDGVTYTIQNEWSNSQNACIARIPGISFNDFSISASPASGAVIVGGGTSATISTATTTGSAQTVTLAVTGAPTGVTASLSPTSVTSGNSSTLSITTTAATVPGTYMLTVTGTAPSGSHSTTYTLTILSDFSISASPGSGSITAGGSTSATIATATTAGLPQSVTLSVSGAPAGVTASVSPSPVTSGSSSTLSISTTTATAAGTYTLTITGTAPSGSHTTSYALTITSDFSISAAPASGSVIAGGSTTSTISTATTAGSAQSIALAVTGAPAGVTATVSPSPVTSGSSSTLSIATTSAAVPGTYTLTVTGTAGSGSHTTSYALTINPLVQTGIVVTPATSTISVGLTKALKATATYNDGSTVDMTHLVHWSSSDITVATVGTAGVAKGVGAGTVTITATKNGFSGTATVTVTVPTLLSITVTPTAPYVVVGSTQAFTATAKYSNGTSQDVTATATWTSATTTVATMSGNTATTVKVGASKITATLGSVSGSTTLNVTATPLVSIDVTPTSTNLPVGYTLQLAAVGTFGDGSKRTLTGSVTWTSSATTVATISNTSGTLGLAKGVGAGTTTISATLDGVTGTATITGTTATLVSITLAPSSATLAIGATQQLAATALFNDSSTLDVTKQVTWSSGSPSVATVGSGGLVKAVASGGATISATHGGIAGTSAITVP